MTGYRYTGQRMEGTGLYDYGGGTRWYDPMLGRWTSPDSIVPLASQGVQAWDRYAFVNNNPVRYNDPGGHYACGRDSGMGGECTNENDPFTRQELEDAIEYNYDINKGLLSELRVDQLQELFYNPLQFLTNNENKGLFDILKEYCRSNAGCKSRPNLVGLIAAGLLITGATILIEYYLFIPAELALLSVITAGGIVAPLAIGLEAILIVESLFLINFDVAY